MKIKNRSIYTKELFFELSCFSILKFILLIVIASTSLLGLAPDEAQYWSWSRALDWGYYSKPPGISWQIFLTTALFGNHELGIRIGAMVIGTALAYALFFFSKKGFSLSKGSFFFCSCLCFVARRFLPLFCRYN